ncbi:MAG: hypothetical protein R8G66_33015 [Cytophagales bacterium]|nr:hypothetical protein [Cytophagales bacterium]
METEITNCVSGFSSLQQAAVTLGSPDQMQDALRNFPGGTEPTELLPIMVWIANHIKVNASKVAAAISHTAEIYSTLQTTQDKANALQKLLHGDPGIVALASAINLKIASLISSLEGWHTDQLSPAIDKTLPYVSDKSKIMAHLNKDMNLLQTLQIEVNQAHNLWSQYTAAATSSSILVTVISFGILLPVSAVLGGALGAQAVKYRKAYDSYITQYNSEEKDFQKKSKLKIDLIALNSELTGYSQMVTNIHSALQEIQQTWGDFEATLSPLVNMSVSQLENEASHIVAKDLHHAAKSWNDISTSASEFLVQSMPTWDTSLSLGDPLPS